MNDIKHTPGRWHVDGHNTVAVIAETIKEGLIQDWKQYQHVCTCNYGYDNPENFLELNKANANLIAAAPDMLEALKEILAAYGVSEYSNLSMWKKGIAAIAKAEGKQ